ncbi:MAG: DUF1385 domain-containing protein [Clostridia bacterium]|nr:DUF1385 domain-containing protein [Clostridia bacterium]
MANDTNKQNCTPCKKTSIGGQALMEGIMMRGPEKTAMAVRNAKGDIILENVKTIPTTAKVYKIPFVRGIFNMGASLVQGYKCLMRSADIAIADAEEADRLIAEQKKAQKKGKTLPEATEDTPTEDSSESKIVKKEDAKNQSAATGVVMVIGVILGLALAIGLFIALPSYLYTLLEKLTGMEIANPYLQGLTKTAFEGVFKIILLVIYMAAVSRMKEIRRVFMYHGAEHKTIFCYEQGLDLTVDNIRPQKRFHPRCGTSFIILVLLVSMIIGFFIPVSLATWQRVLIKIALLPLTIGVGYELIKLAGRRDNLFTRIISKPGVWLQHITTVEPDDSMIECAIAAMNEVIPEDKTQDNW